MQLSIKQMSALLALCPNVEYLEAILNDSIDTYLSKFPQIGSRIYLKQSKEISKLVSNQFGISSRVFDAVTIVVRAHDITKQSVRISYKKSFDSSYDSETVPIEEFDLFFTTVQPIDLPELQETMLEGDVPMAYGKAPINTSSDELV
jgi:hypothetical protein